VKRTDLAALEFDRLLRDHVPALYRHAYRWTGSIDRAEDLVQELLTRLFARLDDLQRLDRVRPWALRVMYRIFVDELRRERRSPVSFTGLSGSAEGAEGEAGVDPEFPDSSAEPSALAEREITQERIAAAWVLLSEEHRVVLSMHDVEGYSLEELAGVIDIPVGTVKSRLHRARMRLRELLSDGTFSASGTCSSMTLTGKAGHG